MKLIVEFSNLSQFLQVKRVERPGARAPNEDLY